MRNAARFPTQIQHLIGALSSTQSFNIIRSHLPRFSRISLQLILCLVVLLNIRSIPGGWHWRVFWPVTKVRLQYLAARANNSWILLLFGAKERKARMEIAMEKWLTSITPVGLHPLETEIIYRSWVSLDESDFNMHMSNSCYPKVLDCARMKAAMGLFPQFLRVGGNIPLSSTHFHFIRELPVFAKYELRLTIGAWDEKWMYVVGRFVTKSKPKSSSSKHRTSTSTTDATPALTTVFNHAPITTFDSSNIITPSVADTPEPGTHGISSTSTDTIDQARKFDTAVSLRLASDLGLDNIDTEVLHTVCVSRVCFKLGRITVPPAVVMATNGMSVHPWEVYGAEVGTDSQMRYSATNPPPTWTINSQELFSKASGGSPRKLREFYKGQWRDFQGMNNGNSAADGAGGQVNANTSSWWNQALGIGGSLSDKLTERLEVCRMLVGGLDGVREM